MIYKRCGHRGRSRDTCEHPWWSQIKYRGRKIQVSLEKYCGQRVRGRGAKSVAQDVQRELKSHIKNGKYFEWKSAQVPVHADITVAQFLDTYVEEHMKARRLSSYGSSERWKIDRVRKRWGTRRLRDLRQIDILSFLNDLRKKDVQPSTIRRHYARINHMLNWAERYEYIDHNPLKKRAFELEPENNERSRRPTPDELDRILAAADGYLRDYLIVKLDTGLRRKGLLHLQLKHVRWGGAGNGVLDLPPRLLKQGKRQLIPMTLAVRAVMERRRTQLEGKRLGDDAFVFGDAEGNGYKSATPVMNRWYAALKTAGIRDPERGIDLDLHEHDLRGECASRLKDQGVAVSMIQRYLGHSSLTMTQRYLRPRVGELEEAAEALDSYATGPTSGPTVVPFAERKSVAG